MDRTSPIHYIAPSAISITPNANASANDLAVYVTEGAKIKVYSPRSGINTTADGAYQEWTLSGRNRRLADGHVPYTIYVRLNKTDYDDAYLLFAAKSEVSGIWKDKYPYITSNGLFTDTVNPRDANYWYVRLGDVTAPDGGRRTVSYDTGVLGTALFNTEWALNPDALPLRIELGCTIDDEDAGPTPYVYWGQTLELTATLVEGWTGTDIKRFDHWEISRNSGSDGDASWPSQQRQEAFASSGVIQLRHTKGSDDDFSGAVSALYTITAWGRSEDSSSNALVVLETAQISILAETVEKYEMSFSSDMVTFNPKSQTYAPADGVAVRFRATDQRGDVFMLTKKQYDDSGLSVSYAPVGSESWITLTPAGAATAVATVTVPVTAFSTQQSVNVRLMDAANKELAAKTIGFLRDGEDSMEREWIFLRSTEAITFGTQAHPYPSAIDYGEVNPTGSADHVTDEKNQEGWVPEGWWDEMQGTDATNRYEYGAYRSYDHDNDEWGAFTTPKIWSHFGQNGKGIDSIVNYYQVGAVAPSLPSNIDTANPDLTGWSTSPSNPPAGQYLWNFERITWNNGDGTYSYTHTDVHSEGYTGSDSTVPGPAGEAAVNVIVAPSSLIVNQSLETPSNLDNLAEQILFSVMKGSVALNVTKIDNIQVEQDSTHNNRNKIAVSGSNSYYATLTAILKDADTNGNYYDQAYFTCRVSYTDNGSTKTVSNVKVKIYANLLGTWKETVEADTKREIGESKWFDYDEATGNIVESQRLGNFVRSSKENTSRLEEVNYISINTGTGTSFPFGFTITSDLVTKYGSNNNLTVRLEMDMESDFEEVQIRVLKDGTDVLVPPATVNSYDTFSRLLTLSAGYYTVICNKAATLIRHDLFVDGKDVNTERYSEVSQTVDGIETTINDPNTGILHRLDTAEGSITTVSRNIPKTNIFDSVDPTGWVKNDAGYPKAEIDVSNYRFHGGNDIYSPIVNLENGMYVFSAYVPVSRAAFDTNGENIVLCKGVSASDRDGSEQISAYTTGSKGDTKIINGVEYVRRYAVFNVVAQNDNYCLNLWGQTADYADVSCPKFETGVTPTNFYIESGSMIKQSADEIDLSIRQGLNNTGINITNQTIKLQADKVIFSDSAGGNTDKISIDPATGTLNATNARITGGVFVDRVDILNEPSFYRENLSGKIVFYDFFEVTKGARYYAGDNYYALGSMTLKCNHLFIYSEGLRNTSASSFDDNNIVISLPPAHHFIGQSIVITNESYGFADDEVMLRVEFLHELDNDLVCMTDKRLIVVDPEYPWPSNPMDIDGAPYLNDGREKSSGQGKTIDSAVLVGGIWQLLTNSQGKKYYEIKDEIEMGSFAWLELTAVNGEYQDWYSVTPNFVRPYNAVWMITRWEKKQQESSSTRSAAKSSAKSEGENEELTEEKKEDVVVEEKKENEGSEEKKEEATK